MSRAGRSDDAREWVARAFTRAEDIVYVGVGILLAASALALLVTTAVGFVGLTLEGTALSARDVDAIAVWEPVAVAVR